MSWFVLALIGVAGAAAHDAVELFEVARLRRSTPSEWRRFPFLLASLVRLVAGGVLVAVLAATGQVSGPIGAFVVGILGPLLLSRIVDFLAPDSAY